MAKLGPRGLALVLDILDAQALGSSGIHIVVSDQAEALAAELRARSSVPVVPIVGPSGDTLADALREYSGAPTLALELVAAGQASALGVLHLLNDQRESLVRRGLCCVVIVAGADARAADAAYLELQAHAPDFWSLRSHVHRLVGEDPEDDARARMLELLAQLGDVVVSVGQWLAQPEPLREWVEHRLWREGPRRDAWMSAVRKNLATRSRSGGSDSRIPQRRGLDLPLPAGPPLLGSPLHWPRPSWPTGQLETSEHAIMRALDHALTRDGWAELACLPEDTNPRALVDVVLTLGLLRESSHPVTLHLDGADGLSDAIARCLSAAGDFEIPDTLADRCFRLGALLDRDSLVLVTQVSTREFDNLRTGASNSRSRMSIVGLVCAEPKSTFAVIAPPSAWPRARVVQSQLHAWLGGSSMFWAHPETQVLELRAALGHARHVVRLADSRPLSPELRTIVGAASERIVELGLEGIPESSLGNWSGMLGTEESDVSEQIQRLARARAGFPFHQGRWPPSGLSVQVDIRSVDPQPSSLFEGLGGLYRASAELHAQGRHEEALRAAIEAVALARELVRSRPGEHDELVAALSLLAERLEVVGWGDESQRVLDEVRAIGGA